MDNISAFKTDRVLRIYFELAQGRALTKRGLAQQFGVTERSIQRDLSALRSKVQDKTSYTTRPLVATTYRALSHRL